MDGKYWKSCENCYQWYWANRTDSKFCQPKCAAAYARSYGEHRTRFHEEKEQYNRATCEHCSAAFEYNDYAQRGGKRKAQYCSNKCRQAAYRERKGASAGYTGHWDDARNDKRTNEEKAKASAGAGAKKDTSHGAGAKKDTSHGAGAKKDTSHGAGAKKDTSHKWWKNGNRYQVIGVTYLNTFKQAKAAYMRLVKLYHPDVSTDPDASEIMQYVNAAWDEIKDSPWAK
jgi:hypothetical protein